MGRHFPWQEDDSERQTETGGSSGTQADREARYAGPSRTATAAPAEPTYLPPQPVLAAPVVTGPTTDTSAFATKEQTSPGLVTTAPQLAGLQSGPTAGAAVSRRPTARGGLRLGELIWLCVAVVDAFLGLDFLFRAIALSSAGFVNVVERVGDSLASPFAPIFANRNVPAVDHTTFWGALLAIVIYTLAAWVLMRLIHLFSHPTSARARRA